jgi:hypothetical protein
MSRLKITQVDAHSLAFALTSRDAREPVCGPGASAVAACHDQRLDRPRITHHHAKAKAKRRCATHRAQTARRASRRLRA